jgi:hypothetical protein
MMPEQLQKHTFNLREGDIDFLTQVYRAKGVPVSMIVRQLIANLVDRLRKQETPVPDLNLEDL